MASSSSGFGSLRGGRGRKFKSEINVVPYIDVMLVLLVIFMVVAPLTNPGVINLPTAEKTALPPTQYIQLSLRQNGSSEIAIQQQGQARDKAETAESRDALMQKLRALHAKNPDYPVLIAAEKDIRYEEVIQVISDAKKLGVNRVGLATR
jgi:biopolymer transport protein TolR